MRNELENKTYIFLILIDWFLRKTLLNVLDFFVLNKTTLSRFQEQKGILK